jgi:hypothetical protein
VDGGDSEVRERLCGYTRVVCWLGSSLGLYAQCEVCAAGDPGDRWAPL